MERLAARRALIFLSIAVWCHGAERWAMQYFYDKNESSLEIVDFHCPSAEHCVAAGVVSFAKHNPKPVAIVTEDGGAHWSQIDLKEEPAALAFLNEQTGWLATDEGVWKTADGGQKWTKLAKLPGLAAIYFLDESHGFAAGFPKAAYSTADGGKTWAKIAAASEPSTDGRPAIYDFIAFAGKEHGFILGHSQSGNGGREPAWLDPQRAKKHSGAPATRILLETKDGGKTWKTFAKEGKSGLLQIAPGPADTALGLFDFPDFAELGTEVRRLNLSTNEQLSGFGAADRLVTSMALFASQGVLAAVEVNGQLKDLPIPGKLVMLSSEDLEHWQEMSVDYRAIARRAILSGPDTGHLWVATDTGMILKLSGQ